VIVPDIERKMAEQKVIGRDQKNMLANALAAE
jgi:hypothetical protein